MRREFFGSAGALPSRKTIRHSLFAIGYSPSFRLGRSLVLPFFPVPRPTPLVPLKVGAQ
jgi:hypothetical protein